MPAVYEIARLRQKVEWLKKVTSSPRAGTNGQPVVTFVSQGFFWADDSPISGNQIVNSTQLVPVRSHNIKMRWGSNTAVIEAEDQLILKGRTLTVTSARTVEERDFWLEITADEPPSNQPGSP